MTLTLRKMTVVATVAIMTAAVSAQDQPESIYAPPAPPREIDKVNEGGIHLDLSVGYATDYVFRGIEPLEVPGDEDSANFQFDGRVSFDLGSKLPHPFVGAFINVADNDPVSDLQELRPYGGFDWTIRPFTFTAGHNTFIFPDRSALDTNEVFAQVKFDDSILYKSDRPFLTPYVFVAYDYDQYNGTYLEAGVEHDFPIEGTGITLTAHGHVSYILNHLEFAGPTGDDTGFQHWQVGLEGRYSLNTLLNTPRRFGEWQLIGYVNYTDGIDEDLRAVDSQLWGGAAIGLHY